MLRVLRLCNCLLPSFTRQYIGIYRLVFENGNVRAAVCLSSYFYLRIYMGATEIRLRRPPDRPSQLHISGYRVNPIAPRVCIISHILNTLSMIDPQYIKHYVYIPYHYGVRAWWYKGLFDLAKIKPIEQCFLDHYIDPCNVDRTVEYLKRDREHENA